MTYRFAVWLLLGGMLAPAQPVQAVQTVPPACGVRLDSFLVTSRLMESEESLALVLALPPRLR